MIRRRDIYSFGGGGGMEVKVEGVRGGEASGETHGGFV